jgi:hypothetical protein
VPKTPEVPALKYVKLQVLTNRDHDASLAELADVKLPPAGIHYEVSCVWMRQWHP